MFNRTVVIGGAMLGVAAAAWGGLFPVAQSALVAIDAFHLTLFRYGLGALIFAAILTATEGRRALRTEGRVLELGLLGTLGYAGFSLFVFTGLPLTTSEHAAVIVTMMPLVTALALWVSRGERPRPATFVAIVLATIGVALIVSKGQLARLFSAGGSLGDALVFIGACCWMLYTVGASRFVGWSPLRYATMTCLPAAVMIALVTVVAGALGYAPIPSLSTVGSVWPELSYTLILASVVAVLAWNAGIRRLGAGNGVLFINLVPVTAFTIGLIQGHTFHWTEIAGSALTLVALFVNALRRRAPSARPTMLSPASRPLSICPQSG
jgi:drug/metabolite transporter (DMT)-like permease